MQHSSGHAAIQFFENAKVSAGSSSLPTRRATPSLESLVEGHVALIHDAKAPLIPVTPVEVSAAEGSTATDLLARARMPSASLFRSADHAGNPIFVAVAPAEEPGTVRLAVAGRFFYSDGPCDITELERHRDLHELREWVASAPLHEITNRFDQLTTSVLPQIIEFFRRERLELNPERVWKGPELTKLSATVLALEKVKHIAYSADDALTLPRWYLDGCEISLGLQQRFSSDLQHCQQHAPHVLREIVRTLEPDLRECLREENAGVLERVLLSPPAFRAFVRLAPPFPVILGTLKAVSDYEQSMLKLCISLAMGRALASLTEAREQNP